MLKWIFANKLLAGVIAGVVVVAAGVTIGLAATGAFSGPEEPTTQVPTTDDWSPWDVTTTEPDTTTETTAETTTEAEIAPQATTARRTTTYRRTTTTARKTTTTAKKTSNNGPYTTIPDNTAKATSTRATTTTKQGGTTTTVKGTTTTSKTTTTTGSSGYVKVTGLSFNLSAITLEKGKTYSSGVTFTPSNATNKNVRFTSSNSIVATVNQSTGVITAVGPGSATITVMSLDPQAENDPSDTMSVTVSEVLVTYFDINGNGIIARGSSTTLTARNFKGEGGKAPSVTAVDWSTSDSGIAMVDQNGRVTGVGAGTCIITATARDRGGYSKDATVIVTN